jgi:two-component system, OmpR family, alkaline phosphatase synthesis response regulator PhoP
VPALHQSSTSTGSPRSVLLLEEYDALGAAIRSALKKFAPEHTTAVVKSVSDAEELAGRIKPELFVIDADPPWPGVAGFLWRMQTAHPRARVVVIGAGIPAEIANERGSFGALQFINKPFELAAFGAAVQAVLGPWRESESALPRGSLGVLTPIDILLLHCAGGTSAVVEIEEGPKHAGKIHIAEGQISHAETGKLRGAEALSEILSWTDGRVSEAKPLVAPRRTIHREWVAILVEALREKKAAATAARAPAQETPPVKTRTKTGKKIVVIDDTEMLLIFVADVLASADPELQITTALTSMEGMEEIERIVPDLVLLDYSLLDLNGDEVCRRLLENERTAQVPVLMMSGHVTEMMEAAAQLANVVATIEKPFLSDALIQRVESLLAAGPLQPQAAPEEVPAPELAKPVPHRQEIPAEPEPPPAQQARVVEEMPPRPEAPRIPRAPQPALSTIVPVAASDSSDTVLGIFLEVLAMQLTPRLQMGAIRAKPASLIASLHLSSARVRDAIPREIGFQLGPVELDRNGRVTTVRIIPTAKPFQPAQMRNAFEIGGVSVVPNNARTRVQLTPAGTTPMTMELLAHLHLAGVELSATFQTERLILKWPTNIVRGTLNPKAPEQSGAPFEIARVRLDPLGRIAELLLKPAKSAA